MKRRMPLIFDAVVTVGILLVGYFAVHQVQAIHPAGATPAETTAHDHANRPEKTGARVALQTRPETPKAGEQSRLSISLRDSSGNAIDDLVTHHARKLHVVIISEDMQVFGHIHPQDFDEPISNGHAAVFFTFPHAGRYLVAADLMTEEGRHAEQFIVDVEGRNGHVAVPQDVETEKAVALPLENGDRYTKPILLSRAREGREEYSVSLRRPDVIEAGEPVRLVYHISRNGAPLTELRPYLDAPMHLAVVRDDLGRFLHEHGEIAAVGQNQAGHGPHASHGHAHASDHHAHADSFGPEITTTLTFPERGTYHLFGQAAHDNDLIVSRLRVDVR